MISMDHDDILISPESRGSSVKVDTRLRAGQSGFNFRHEPWRNFFLFTTASRPAL